MDVRIGVFGRIVLLIIDQIEGVLVEYQVNNAAFVLDGSCSSVFGCLCLIRDIDLFTDYFS